MHYTTSCNTQSSAPEDERNCRPKHVEVIGFINKPLLLNIVGCLYHCISDAILAYADDVNILGGSAHTVKEECGSFISCY